MLGAPPDVLVLDADVVKTARGALIVWSLRDQLPVDIRVLTRDDKVPVLLSEREIALQAASEPLQVCGTRGAPRFAMNADVQVVVDGEPSRLVNLSTSGAQVLIPAWVRPKQSVRVTLLEDESPKRFRALVAWSAAELAQYEVKYRAGVVFVEPDTRTIEAFCRRHSAVGDNA